MDTSNLQSGSSSLRESLHTRNTDDLMNKESRDEMSCESDVIKCLDFQYFDIKDAPNEIIVTTDREDEEEEEIFPNVEPCTDDYEEGSEMKTNGQVFMSTNLDDIKKLIKSYCEQTCCQFVGQVKSKEFGVSSSEFDLSGHRIQWQDTPHKNSADDILTFDGIPHMCVGHYQFGCEFGVDLKASRKEKLQKMKEDGTLNVKSRNVKVPSKKCGCPAKILVRQIMKFPEFKILKNTEGRKRTGATKLKESLKNNRDSVEAKILYIGRLPNVSEHKFHELMEGRESAKEMIHPELVVKAQELYLENKSVLEIYELLRHHVVNEMFWKNDPPDPSRRRFFPKQIDIRNIVSRIRRLSRFTEEEEACVRTFIDETKTKYEDANIFFDVNERIGKETMENCMDMDETSPNPFQTNKTKKENYKLQTFIFCYQTHSQQWLIKRYNYTCFLAEVETEASMKCALPYKLYCLLVQTNVDFQAVGMIVVSKQRKYGLIEGLKIFREWNISWNPDYFLVDYSEDIQEAISAVFTETTYFLNPQSCKRKWLQFLNTPSNDLQDYSERLSTCLESMQCALTEDSLTIFATLLESNEVWKNNENLRNWFQNSWLHSANKWVFGYRPDDLIIMQHLKISLDDSLQVYKDVLGKSDKTNGVFDMLQEITNVITVQEYEKYVRRNNQLHSSQQQLEKRFSFPDYMQGLPTSLFPYVETILKIASERDFNLTHDRLGLFKVQLLQQPPEMESGTNTKHTSESECAIPPKNNKTYVLIPSDVAFANPYTEHSNPYTEHSNPYTEHPCDTDEFTVSFGDSRSYPFCTCPHWKLYKLPCVHICAVCCKLPGWRYLMFSSLYRSNPIFHIDYSCLDDDYQRTEPDGDRPLDFITGNIFESFLQVGANDVILDKSNAFLQHVNKMMFLFRDKRLYANIHNQLGEFVGRLKTYLKSEGTGNKLSIPSSSLQRQSNSVAVSMDINTCDIIKPTVYSSVATHTKSSTDGLDLTKVCNSSIPRLRPIVVKRKSKYIVPKLEPPSSKSDKNELDTVCFDIDPVDNGVNIASGSTAHGSGVAGAKHMSSDNNFTAVRSLLLGKRLSTSLNLCTNNNIKRKHLSETSGVPGTPSSTEKIVGETCVTMSLISL